MSNNTHSSTNHPSNPTSALSRTARIAHFLTGGSPRTAPSSMTQFLRMANERNQVERAEKAWKTARKDALGIHEREWGKSGIAGVMEDAMGTGPRPRGTKLIRWYKETGGGGGGEGGGRQETTGEITRSVRSPEPVEQQQPPSENGVVDRVEGEDQPQDQLPEQQQQSPGTERNREDGGAASGPDEGGNVDGTVGESANG